MGTFTALKFDSYCIAFNFTKEPSTRTTLKKAIKAIARSKKNLYF